MLKIFDKLYDIDFRQLMDVYVQSNRNNGRILYPNLSENLQILYAEQDFYTFLVAFFAETSARYYIWYDESRYVSALRIEAYCDGLLLEAIETAPDDRGRGYAAALIRAVISHISSATDVRIYSHVSKDNYASLRLHETCGFCVYSEHATFIDGTEHPDCYTLLHES